MVRLAVLLHPKIMEMGLRNQRYLRHNIIMSIYNIYVFDITFHSENVF